MAGEDSLWEVHPDGVLKWSQLYLQDLWKVAVYQGFQQQDADRQDAEKQDAEKQDADKQDIEQLSTEGMPAAATKLPDEMVLKLHQKVRISLTSMGPYVAC